jgi:hypothetical protein
MSEEGGGSGLKGRLEYERERMRDWEREKEIERDRRQREGDYSGVDRPFASLREIEMEENSIRRSSDATTRKNSYDFV